MAKKTKRQSGGAGLVARGEKPVQVGFGAEDHRRLRVAAATAGVSMTEFVRRAALAAVAAALTGKPA